MASFDYSTFVSLAGASLVVRHSNVTALEATPAALLPAGVVAGTRISLAGGADYVDVQGTVAATLATLENQQPPP